MAKTLAVLDGLDKTCGNQLAAKAAVGATTASAASRPRATRRVRQAKSSGSSVPFTACHQVATQL